jgi:hypothetical protein
VKEKFEKTKMIRDVLEERGIPWDKWVEFKEWAEEDEGGEKLWKAIWGEIKKEFEKVEIEEEAGEPEKGWEILEWGTEKVRWFPKGVKDEEFWKKIRREIIGI